MRVLVAKQLSCRIHYSIVKQLKGMKQNGLVMNSSGPRRLARTILCLPRLIREDCLGFRVQTNTQCIVWEAIKSNKRKDCIPTVGGTKSCVLCQSHGRGRWRREEAMCLSQSGVFSSCLLPLLSDSYCPTVLALASAGPNSPEPPWLESCSGYGQPGGNVSEHQRCAA